MICVTQSNILILDHQATLKPSSINKNHHLPISDKFKTVLRSSQLCGLSFHSFFSLNRFCDYLCVSLSVHPYYLFLFDCLNHLFFKVFKRFLNTRFLRGFKKMQTNRIMYKRLPMQILLLLISSSLLSLCTGKFK